MARSRLPRRRAAWPAAALAALLLQACATYAPPLAGRVYTGRIAVRSDADAGQAARSVSGSFELSGNPSVGQLVLTSPIGVTVARARWADPRGAHGEPSTIELEANGATTRYASLEEMMQRAIGEQLPVAAMFDWLAGRPWAAAPAAVDGAGPSFEQLGWQVDESQFAAAGLIDARRPLPAPALHVRVKLDAPEAAASAASGAGS
jgi:outer membrane lipoprotein LolB